MSHLRSSLLKYRMFMMSALFTLATLSGCGTDDSSKDGSAALVSVTVSASQPKVLSFSWNDVGADHYKLLKNQDGASGYSQVGLDITTTSVDEAIAVHLQDWVNASYIVQSCNALGACTDSAVITATTAMLGAIGYFKASNSHRGDNFGYSMALSADGSTLAVGALWDDSGAMGINGDADDKSENASGAAHLFIRIGNIWSQQAYIKASNTDTSDQFGRSIALSADGNTLAVGTIFEDSATTGINGDEGDNVASAAGAVYLFSRTGISWSQQAYIKASNTDARDWFGTSVALSDDGDTLAVGAEAEESNATGINGDESDNSGGNSGAVYLFGRTDGSWTQQAYIKASNAAGGDYFGASVALSADGDTLAVGANEEDSGSTGINGDESENSLNVERSSGAVYLFIRTGSSWSQQAYIKASNTGEYDEFGGAVALSADGDTLAVGANNEDSAAMGINGDGSDNSVNNAGAVYLFSRTDSSWSQQAYINASNTGVEDFFGTSVALSADGDTLVVGANDEESAATGINGDESDNNASDAGAVYLFIRTGSSWSQQTYIKASNTDADDQFGWSVALSADGDTLAVGANKEGSAAMGINGDESDNSENGSGAVYLY